MNRYELRCQYCDRTWEINYLPQTEVRCSTCNNRNIAVKDLYKEKVDYYVGCPPFPDKDDSKNWNF